MWSQVEFARQHTRSRPRLAAVQLHGNAPASTNAKNLQQCRLLVVCGPDRIRTGDLLIANEAL